MNSDHSRKGFMHCVSSRVGGGDFPIHVEVDTVSAKDLRLATMIKLGVSNMSFKSVDSLPSKHKVSAILPNCRSGITHDLNVSRQ
jgi:hypothetical protein